MPREIPPWSKRFRSIIWRPELKCAHRRESGLILPNKKRIAFGRFSARKGDRAIGLFALGAAVAVTFDDNRLSVMQETIQQSGSHGGVSGEDSRPVLEGDVGSDDDRAALVAFGDDLKEQLCASLVQGQVP